MKRNAIAVSSVCHQTYSKTAGYCRITVTYIEIPLEAVFHELLKITKEHTDHVDPNVCVEEKFESCKFFMQISKLQNHSRFSENPRRISGRNFCVTIIIAPRNVTYDDAYDRYLRKLVTVTF